MDTDNRNVLQEYQVERELLNLTRGEANNDRAALPRDTFQRV